MTWVLSGPVNPGGWASDQQIILTTEVEPTDEAPAGLECTVSGWPGPPGHGPVTSAFLLQFTPVATRVRVAPYYQLKRREKPKLN